MFFDDETNPIPVDGGAEDTAAPTEEAPVEGGAEEGTEEPQA